MRTESVVIISFVMIFEEILILRVDVNDTKLIKFTSEHIKLVLLPRRQRT